MSVELTPDDRREIAEFSASSMTLVHQSEDPHTSVVIHDTVLAALTAVRIAAKRCGYAVGWHGSLARDVDLIAVPWVDHAYPPREMVDHVVNSVGGWIKPSDNCPREKPHGRLAWSIHLLGTGTYIDLSVMPLITTTEAPTDA